MNDGIISLKIIRDILLAKSVQPKKGDVVKRSKDGKVFEIVEVLKKRFIVKYNGGAFGINKKDNEFEIQCPIIFVNYAS